MTLSSEHVANPSATRGGVRPQKRKPRVPGGRGYELHGYWGLPKSEWYQVVSDKRVTNASLSERASGQRTAPVPQPS